MVAKNELTQLVNKGLSLRQIAKRLGVTHTTINNYLKEYGLKTIYSTYKPKKTPKRRIFTNGEIAYFLDTSVVSIKKIMKHKRTIPYSFLVVYNALTEQKGFYFYAKKENQITTTDVKIGLLALKEDLSIDLTKLFCVDTKHNKLAKILKITNLDKWCASKGMGDKCFGLKALIYAHLQFLKDMFNLTDEDLFNLHGLVLKTYINVLKEYAVIKMDSKVSTLIKGVKLIPNTPIKA